MSALPNAMPNASPLPRIPERHVEKRWHQQLRAQRLGRNYEIKPRLVLYILSTALNENGTRWEGTIL